ncbi:MAG TPA: CsbD family protein [Thermoanaerobaculia bacterium]|nr:CsbD family protein [Thermoanaerobaculia bacterium]
MFNKNGRTDAEEAVANQAGGVVNQIKGRVKQAVGDLTGDHSMRASGTKDKLKGKLQEAYGDVKEREANLEADLLDVDKDPRI